MSECPLVIRLVEPSLGELVIDGVNGHTPQRLDLGPTTARVVSDNRTGVDGADDRTALAGARAVALTVLLEHDKAPGRTIQDLTDDLMAYFHPRRRVELYFVAREGEEERRLLVAGHSAAPALAAPLRVFDVVQGSWRWPDGVQEGAEEIDTLAASGDAGGGIVFPIHFPLAWPASDVAGVEVVTNRGKEPVPPLLRLYGPATDPRIENRTTDRRLEFTNNGGLTLAAGEYLEVDVREHTARLGGDATQSRYSRLDTATSDWWVLPPGDSELRYYPVTFDADAVAEVRRRPAWT